MAERSNIEWCDATFNPWIGCTKVSPACDHCYAERDFDLRRHVVQWGAGQARKRTAPANWKKPLQWNKRPFYACACGYRGEKTKPWREIGICCPRCEGRLYPARRRVFCASLADVFDNEVPVEWLVDLLDLIRSTPNLDWLLLSKRIGNWRTRVLSSVSFKDGISQELAGFLGGWLDGEPPRNLWLGATICNQAEADRDIPKLLAVPARVRFLSVEPMLGPVDLTNWLSANALHEIDGGPRIDWVIDGGESGPHARPSHPEWFRSMRDQCAAAGVAYLHKQNGEWAPGENVERRTGVVQSATWFNGKWLIGTEDLAVEDGHIDDEPDLYRVGKKAAGRLLDGVEHNGFPEVTP